MTSTADVRVSPEAWLADHESDQLAALYDFLRIPSVSTNPAHAGDVRRAAEWLRDALRRIGFTADVHATPGHPVMLAEWRQAPGAPTLLVYGHYDVQPPEPLEQWTSPPFEPTVRDDRLYARGAADDKGQLWIHVSALAAHLATRGTLPINVVLLVEGEEEVGSKNLLPFIQANRDRLACDSIVISDTAMLAEGIPSVLASLRGICYCELRVTGPAGDLHSGQYGGAVANPAVALARILATLHDANGRIAIPEFYDTVRDPSPETRARVRSLPFDDAAFKGDIGVDTLWGDPDYAPLERLWLRPTCEINGLLSGYTGEGAKTVLPSTAMAKVSFRLVPDQTPEQVEQVFARHVARVTPPGVTASVRRLHGGPWWQAQPSGVAFEAAQRALTTAFGREAVIGGSGGSIPIVRDLERALGAPALLLGFGLPTENAHAPNEWLSLDNFRRGSRAIAALLDALRGAS